MYGMENNATIITQLIADESARQHHQFTLIASENYASAQVMAASGSVLTNKYAEGYPGKRYYAGCKIIDTIETIAIDRCKKLFHVPHCNVQPHAGSQANLAVYFALLNPGDTIMGLALSSGGHLTHGHSTNITGKWFKAITYDLDPKTEQFDFDHIADIAQKHKPKLIITGASAYSRTIHFDTFQEIAKNCGAYLLADIAHIAGLVAVGLHPHPYPYADVITSTTHKTLRGPRGGLIMCKQELAEAIDRAVMPGTQGGPFMQQIAAKAVAFGEALEPSFYDYQKQVIKNSQVMAKTFNELGYRIVSGGTDNHLFIVDLTPKDLNGLQAQIALEKAGIIVSRSTIPFDVKKPWIGSGIRIGSPAITTRGLKEQHAQDLVHIMHEALKNHDKDSVLTSIAEQIELMARGYPLFKR